MKTKFLTLIFLLTYLAGYSQFGTVVGSFNGITAYSNGSNKNVSGLYNYMNSVNTGMKWQCVEYAQRYYYLIYGIDINPYFSNANSFYDSSNASSAGLTIYPNGRNTPPQVGDIICSNGGENGHVAIVREVGSNYIKVIQQNWSNTTDDNSKKLARAGNYISDFGPGYPVQGWLRDEKKITVTYPNGGETLYKGDNYTRTWTSSNI